MKLIVPYRGAATISGLVARYEFSHPDVNDSNFSTRKNDDVEIEVDFYPLPVTMHTDEIFLELVGTKQRCLTVAETLALGICHKNGPLVSLAEPLRRGLMLHVVIACGNKVQLGGFKSNWLRGLKIPVTRNVR